jgi:hypothetical protein
LQGSVGVQGAAAGVGMGKPLSGDSGFFIFSNYQFTFLVQ